MCGIYAGKCGNNGDIYIYMICVACIIIVKNFCALRCPCLQYYELLSTITTVLTYFFLFFLFIFL